MKQLLSLLICIFFVTSLAAQVSLKPSIGMNFTDGTRTPSNGDIKAKVGFQIGSTVTFGNKFYFEPGLFYVSKSSEFQYLDSGVFKAGLGISGIRVPIGAGVNLLGHDKSAVGLRAFGGLSGFFVTSVGDDLDADQVNKTNFGLFAGAGIDIWKAFLELSYEWSLTNIQKDVSQIDLGKTRTFYISAGLRFPLKK